MAVPRRFLPSIASLRALEALDRLGSASAAAQELAQTQSAVSRQLQALETQLGVDMIRREKRALALTAAGKTYAGEIRQALNRIANAALKLQAPGPGGTLNLAILPAFGMRWLMPRLPEFARRHPEVTINMATRLETVDFDLDPFDAAIHFGRPDSSDRARGQGWLLLKHETVVPVCAPALLGPAPDLPLSAARLMGLPLLHIQTRPRAWPDWFSAQGLPAPPRLGGTLHDQFSTITQAALHGLGVALMPDYLVEEDLATGRLVAVQPRAEAPGAYYLTWPADRAEDPGLRLFRDWLAPLAQAEDPLPR